MIKTNVQPSYVERGHKGYCLVLRGEIVGDWFPTAADAMTAAYQLGETRMFEALDECYRTMEPDSAPVLTEDEKGKNYA